jgi:hypothetical protein
MLSDAQIERIPNHQVYWEVSGREAEARTQKELQALAIMPRDSLPLFSIGDYEKARKGEAVPIEQPKPIPIGARQITDNRTMSQYIRHTEPAPAPALMISEYLRQVGDASPLLANP